MQEKLKSLELGSDEMQEIEQQCRLEELYLKCINELNSIGINMHEKEYGEISIKISKRNNKRYGCCKQENPDSSYKFEKKIGRHKCIKYERFNKHTIEVSKWVMDLDEEIIKNTIMHELIHCMPFCNNHGEMFKKYARYINKYLGYDISRLGNKKEDYEKSNIKYEEKQFKYTIKCENCGKVFHRNRLNKDFFKKYRCLCNGKLILLDR